MRTMLSAAAFALVLGASSAWAGCYYDGIYYQAGAQICFDGWYQECTVADYWKAIGMCKAPDTPAPQVDLSPLADRLFAMALDAEPKPYTALPTDIR